MAEFKNFLGAKPTQEKKPADSDARFFCGLFAFTAGRIAEAYRCFSAQDENNLPAKFNLALCCWKAGLLKQALTILENAEKLLPAPAEPEPPVASGLTRAEAAGNGYKEAMLQEEFSFFPQECKLRLLRVKADLLFESGATEELKLLLPALQGKGFANIEIIQSSINGGKS